MKYTPYSFSKISTYKTCPRKFKYCYIDKVKKNKIDMTALLKGGAVHSILENYPEKSTHKLAPKYQHIVDEFIQTDLGKKYLNEESIREFGFGLTEDLTPTIYSDKSAIFRGWVDYICTIDDLLYICDWKSGKAKDPKWQEYDQLMFYAIYFFQRYEKIDRIKISYVYVEHKDCENDILLERKYLDNYKKDLLDSISKIEMDEVFDKKPSLLCEYCEFKDHCLSDLNVS